MRVPVSDQTLVLLGGPTGVGKTTTLKLLQGKLNRCGLLDADDVWRVGKELAVPDNRPIAIQNVVDAMRGYFRAHCDIGIVAWVFARAELYQPVIDGLRDEVDAVRMVYLIADPRTLEARLKERGEPERVDYSLTRLELIQALPFPKIDTTNLMPDDVASRVCDEILNGAATSLD